MEDFQTWLADGLRSLSLDEEVYTQYVQAILEDEDDDSREEAITSLLDQSCDDQSFSDFVKKLFNQWDKFKALEAASQEAKQQADTEKAAKALQLEHEKLKMESPVNTKAKADSATDRPLLASFVYEEGDNELEGSMNSNKSKAKAYLEQQKQQRKESHVQHKQEIKRMQENEAKKKAEKEAKKKARPQKLERRR